MEKEEEEHQTGRGRLKLRLNRHVDQIGGEVTLYPSIVSKTGVKNGAMKGSFIRASFIRLRVPEVRNNLPNFLSLREASSWIGERIYVGIYVCHFLSGGVDFSCFSFWDL